MTQWSDHFGTSSARPRPRGTKWTRGCRGSTSTLASTQSPNWMETERRFTETAFGPYESIAKGRFQDVSQAGSSPQTRIVGSVDHDLEVLEALALPDQADDEHVLRALEVRDTRAKAGSRPGARRAARRCRVPARWPASPSQAAARAPAAPSAWRRPASSRPAPRPRRGGRKPRRGGLAWPPASEVQASAASVVGDGVQLSPVVGHVRRSRAAGQAVLDQGAQPLDSLLALDLSNQVAHLLAGVAVLAGLDPLGDEGAQDVRQGDVHRAAARDGIVSPLATVVETSGISLRTRCRRQAVDSHWPNNVRSHLIARCRPSAVKMLDSTSVIQAVTFMHRSPDGRSSPRPSRGARVE